MNPTPRPVAPASTRRPLPWNAWITFLSVWFVPCSVRLVTGYDNRVSVVVLPKKRRKLRGFGACSGVLRDPNFSKLAVLLPRPRKSSGNDGTAAVDAGRGKGIRQCVPGSTLESNCRAGICDKPLLCLSATAELWEWNLWEAFVAEEQCILEALLIKRYQRFDVSSATNIDY